MIRHANKSKRRIFLVDDCALVRDWLVNVISSQSDLAVCGQAESAREAMNAIDAAKPDLLIVEVSLKDSSGIELIKSLKRDYPGVQVLVLSKRGDADFVKRALRAGAGGYISKREAKENVIEAVHGVLDGALYLGGSVKQALAMGFVDNDSSGSLQSVEQLSDRELEVFDLLGQGHTATGIANMLQISVKTVHTYRSRIREKWRLKNSAELFREAVHWRVTHPLE